ncbi:type VI secretion system tube protein TssD [Desulfovibrio inopinatus]|uniref:type VI secretion system tube protein TssD n=1 Tax=Desulfovibrio inopinatus TaxID=102109 RepID=UPI0003FCEDCF|nr:type VI secretion system tube protein TssD [Desulfovibrio inopinatus]
MALTAYMKVTGKSQGQIKGDCTQSDSNKKDNILVYDISHTIEIPKDTHTGLPTGQRIHHPLIVITHVGPQSPKLLKSLCTGEQCTVNLYYFRIKDTGEEENYFNVELDEAIIVQKKHFTPTTFLPDNKPYHDMEEIQFTYSKITHTYTDGNIEYTDSWKDS